MKKSEGTASLKSSVLIFVVLYAGLTAAAPPSNPDPEIGPLPLYDSSDAWCEATYSDPDGAGRLNVTWKVAGSIVKTNETGLSSGQTLNTTLDASNFDEPDNVLCNATAIDGAENTSDFYEVNAVTAPPEILSGPRFYNYSSVHKFNVSAVVVDNEGDDDIRNCWINVDDYESRDNYSMTLDRSYSNETTARCFYSSLENTTDHQVLEELNVTVFVNDTDSDWGNSSALNVIPNSPPLAYNVLPVDGATVSGTSVTLEAKVNDNDGERIDLDFYNSTGSPPEHLQGFNDLNPGEQVSYTWGGLRSLETYRWYIRLWDGHQEVIERFSFRTLIAARYRVQTSFGYDYSSIITSPETRVIPFTVENVASVSKDLNSTVSGFNAEFVSENDPIKTYTLAPGEERTFRVQISPDGEGEGFLNVTTKNRNFNLVTEDSIPVYVKSRPANTAELPGIGVFQVLFLYLLVSTLYYSGLL